jgi:hypothetical protein
MVPRGSHSVIPHLFILLFIPQTWFYMSDSVLGAEEMSRKNKTLSMVPASGGLWFVEKN